MEDRRKSGGLAPGVVHALLRNRRGVSVVEFAIIAMPFFLLLTAIFEQGLLFYKHEILQSAVNDTARLIMTGQANQAGYSKEQFRQQLCANIPSLIACSSIAVDVRPFTSFSTAKSSLPVDNQGNYDATRTVYDIGDTGGIVVVSGYTMQPVLFLVLNAFYANSGSGKALISAQAVFRNEPY